MSPRRAADSPPRSDLCEHVREITRVKYEFDDRLAELEHAGSWKRAASWLSGILPPPPGSGSAPTLSPTAFLESVLPFTTVPECEAEQYDAEVDPSLVIGQTYKVKHQRRLAGATTGEQLQQLVTQVHTKDRPRFLRIGDLPLYVAHEGKNRILLYRRADRPVDATVSVNYFPQPEDLELHPVLPWRTFVLRFAGSPERFPYGVRGLGGLLVRPILFADVVVPLLRAYGVRVGRSIVAPTGLVAYVRARRKLTRSTITSY